VPRRRTSARPDPMARTMPAGYSLARGQAGFIDALQQGPSAFPEGLFSGSVDRAMLGLKAHANTISHARLVALEDTFPRLRQRIGTERFNTLSRDYVETPAAMASALPQIGRDFAAHIAAAGLDAASLDLARIEWLWLESYHAAEAEALDMAAIAALDEAGLLDLLLRPHPALRTLRLSAPIAPELGLDDGAADAAMLLITRPDADVLVQPLDGEQALVLELAQQNPRMRNLLEMAVERMGEAKALPHIFAIIAAGALAKPTQ